MFSISLTRAMSIHLICNSICLDIWDPLETSQKFYGNPVGSLWNHAEIEWESLEILRKSYGARRKSDANPMEILRKSYGIPWKYETKWDPANPNESTWISVRHGPGPGPAKPRDAGGSCKVHVSWMDIFSHIYVCKVDRHSELDLSPCMVGIHMCFQMHTHKRMHMHKKYTYARKCTYSLLVYTCATWRGKHRGSRCGIIGLTVWNYWIKSSSRTGKTVCELAPPLCLTLSISMSHT